MPQTATKHSSAKSATRPRRTTARKQPTMIETTTKLSEDVLDSLEKGQLAAIDAVREFVDRVDRALPAGGDGPSKRQEIVDSALEMSDRLVKAQHDFITKVIESAGKSIGEARRVK